MGRAGPIEAEGHEVNSERRGRQNNAVRRRAQSGFTLIELMFAAVVMAIGLTGGLLLMVLAVAENGRDKMDSSGTVLAQMTAEMIATVSASSSSTVTVVDCNPTSSSASHTISTAGSSSGAGAPLTSGGAIDFTQSTVSGYSMSYYACQASSGDRQAIYDVRWNVKTINSNTKLVTVAAQMISSQTGSNPIAFAVPTSLKLIVGL